MINSKEDHHKDDHLSNGHLYVVATPIGNLQDISLRALDVLRHVDYILVEDTRHARKLLDHYAINKPLISLHMHNESRRSEQIIEKTRAGNSLALLSDAGTPLISDPGFPLVRDCRESGVPVTPIPGACALIAALSACGLPTDRFVFEGFLPAKESARLKRLNELLYEIRTIVLYESSHRIVESLESMITVFGGSRQAVVSRELTKKFESWYRGDLDKIKAKISSKANNKGEFVIVIAGSTVDDTETSEAKRVMQILMGVLSLKDAAAIGAQLTGEPKNNLYKIGLAIAKS